MRDVHIVSSKPSLVAVTAVTTTAALSLLLLSRSFRKRKKKQHLLHSKSSSSSSYEKLIGNTPLIKLEKLSALIKRDIFVKMECLNPSGTGKDRAALYMLREAEKQLLVSNQLSDNTKYKIVEGTSGSTGIALAALCASNKKLNLECVVVLPDDQAKEKVDILLSYGATVKVVPNCAISNPNHYVNQARLFAKHNSNTVFINQFENLSNYQAHYETTGPEIWAQMMSMSAGRGGDKNTISAFVMSSGTGGTIAGAGTFLKTQNSNIKVVLVDPPGSSLYNKVKFGVAYASEQKEQGMKRHRYDTLAEGIGLDRITKNFHKAQIDDAVRVMDQEAVYMAHWLLREEGVFVGSSSAMNVVGAVRTALTLKEGSRVVTVICDGGQRHLTRFWNRAFIENVCSLKWPTSDDDPNDDHCSSYRNIVQGLQFLKPC